MKHRISCYSIAPYQHRIALAAKNALGTGQIILHLPEHLRRCPCPAAEFPFKSVLHACKDGLIAAIALYWFNILRF